MGDPQLQAIWHQALENYRKDVGVDLNDKSIPHPESIEQLISLLQTRHARFDKLTGHSKEFPKYLKNVVGPFNLLQGMFGGMAGVVFPPSSQILGAVSVLVEAGKNVTDAFDAVSGLFQHLSAFTTRLKALLIEMVDEELTPVLANILSAMLKILALATKRTHEKANQAEDEAKHPFHHKLKKSVKINAGEYLRQLFMGKDAEINNAVDELKSLVDEEQKLTTTIVKKDTTRIKGDTSALRGDTATLREDAAFLKGEALYQSDKLMAMETTQEQLVSIFRERFNPAKPQSKVINSRNSSDKSHYLRKLLRPLEECSSELERMISDRAKGSLDGVASDAAVQQWLNHEIPMLQLSSGVGTGKSFFASRVLDLLHDTQQDGQDGARHSTGYTFWKQGSAQNVSISRLLQTLAFQLAQSDAAYKEHLVRELRKLLSHEDQDVQYWWNTLFESYFKKAHARAFLVIDGLDDIEEEDVDLLLDCFRALLSAHGGKWPLQLHCFFCTGPDLAKKIQAVFAGDIIATQWENTVDLQIYIAKRLERTWKNMLVDTSLYQVTKEAISKASQGNYLLASLLVDDVTALTREKDVRHRLLALPVNLDSATPLALNRLERQLDHDDMADLTDILAWVMCTRRSLSLRELDALLSLRSSDSGRIIDLETRMGKQFSSLFVLSNQGVGVNSKQLDTRKRLADKEYVRVSGVLLPNTAGSGHDNVHDKLVLEDPDHLTTVSARLEKVYVRFEHGLIADHIKDDTAISVVAGTRLGQLRVNVLRGCLEALCGELSFESEDRKVALAYCGLFASDHILDVDVSKVDSATKRWIAIRLVQLFRDDAVIHRWIMACSNWLLSDVLLNKEFVARVCQWLEDGDAKEGLDGDTMSWVKGLAETPMKLLFEKLALAQAKLWLQERTAEGTTYFEFVNTYLTLASTDTRIYPLCDCPWLTIAGWQIELPNEILPDVDQDLSVFGASPGRIREVARWAKLEETAFWHSRIGFALRNGNHWSDAIEEYELALQKDPLDGMPWAALATVHDENGSYDEAIDCAKRSIELFEKAWHADTGEFKAGTDMVFTAEEDFLRGHWLLGDYYLHTGDVTAAVENYQIAYSRWSESYQDSQSTAWRIGSGAATDCLGALLAHNRFDGAVQLLDILSKHPLRYTEAFLAVYNFTNGHALLRVAYETKRLNIVERFHLNATWTSAHFGTGQQTAQARYYRALTIFRLDRTRQTDALELFEAIATSDDVDEPGSARYGLHATNEKSLAAALLNQILQAREDDDWVLVGQYAKIFRDRIRPGGNEDSELVLAVWERLNGRFHRARRHLTGQLSIGIDLLSDEDPLNDSYAWEYLSRVFLALGDTSRAVTCTQAYLQLLVQSTLEYQRSLSDDGDHKSEVDELQLETTEEQEAIENPPKTADLVDLPTQTEDATRGKTELSLLDLEANVTFFYCDGPCFNDLRVQDLMYRCSYCFTDFCKSCHELVMSDQDTGWNVCSKLHKHDLVPGMTELHPEGKLKVGDVFVEIKTWMQDMQTEYGLTLRETMESGAEVSDTVRASEPGTADGGLEEDDTKQGAPDESEDE